jgi:hypothetical protein
VNLVDLVNVNFKKGIKEMTKKIITYILIVIVAVGIIVGGFYAYQQLSKTDDTIAPIVSEKCNASSDGKTITYNGKEGSTAMALLIENCTVESNGTGESAFITSINGVKASSSNEGWMYKINGTDAMVGAGQYITKNDDVITWTLATFSF